MSEHPNVARISAGYAAFANGDFTGLDEVFAEDLIWHEPGRNPLSGDYIGRDATYAHFGKLAEVLQGSLRMEVQSIFADDDHAVALVSSTAAHDGHSLSGYGAHIFRLVDGKVVEFWGAPTDPYAFDELLR